ncbi:ABC transporter ATP-binding protein [Pseudocolwellia agarivorans]|uniref:ABC transporter ATP-binding protein n=1 Tax=Pseudocolwellia agarivorans TaxID=1911682 RepID=UPI000984A1F7|nr:ABC transporter ATP-binding protein [Pseudocolwellia agarivorans]
MSLLIKVEGLNKRYGNKHALKNVNFEINKGDPVALVGPNGAGKTTLFSILCGYIPYDSGNVSILGESPSIAAVNQTFSALPQDAQLDPKYSIESQLKFYAQLQGFSTKQSVIEAHKVLDMVGLEDNYKVKPLELSHGMRKRAAIAQSLIGSPQLVILDEATAGLDPKHAKDIREIISNLSNEITFVLSSHDLSELERLCDQVLYLENGELKEHQTLTSKDDFNYLTLRMKQHSDSFVKEVSMLPSVQNVSQLQGKEYLISYTQLDNTEPFDITFLKYCHKQNWIYSQLVNGKTLENQLF